MGISKQQAAQNREAIIGAAEKLFREKSVSAVGLNDLMEAAGFTRGGFYNHFKSKDALVAAVMDKAMQSGAANLASVLETSLSKGRDPVDGQIEWYLSGGHCMDVAGGCPLSGFAGDVRRLDDEARTRYVEGLKAGLEWYTGLVAAPGEDPAAARARAIAMFSGMVGTLLLSRAVVGTDRRLSDEILESGRRQAYAAAVPAVRKKTKPGPRFDRAKARG
jgi:TetR/AcrR family transcriptional regulator, transcriptional repressor for nem operon